jgi:hypothetical protein
MEHRHIRWFGFVYFAMAGLLLLGMIILLGKALARDGSGEIALPFLLTALAFMAIGHLAGSAAEVLKTHALAIDHLAQRVQSIEARLPASNSPSEVRPRP